MHRIRTHCKDHNVSAINSTAFSSAVVPTLIGLCLAPHTAFDLSN